MTQAEVKAQLMTLYPKTCPACGAPIQLSKNMMHLYCTNPACSGKLYRRVEILAKAVKIENIGTKVAEELVEHCNLNSLEDFLHLTTEQILQVPRYRIGMAAKIHDSIQAGLRPTFTQFIRALQLRQVGDGTAAKLTQRFHTLDELLKASPREISKCLNYVYTPNGVADMIHDDIQARMEEIISLSKVFTIQYTEEVPQENTGIPTLMAVVTGSLVSATRPTFQKTYGANHGIRWVSAVSGNTDILVTNEASTSSKYRAAKAQQEKGGKIKIMTEMEFIQFCKSRKSGEEEPVIEGPKEQQGSVPDMFTPVTI